MTQATNVEIAREEANDRAVERMVASQPVLIDIQPAGQAVPGFKPNTILTSGAPLSWGEYEGGQRRAILGAVVFEGLAKSLDEAESRVSSGEIELGACHDFGCVGSLTGVYSASMPVLVVEDRTHGNRSFCTVYEGPARERLTYGIYNEQVHANLEYVRDTIGPLLGRAVRHLGGVELRPLMRRALNMGDELHTRNTAATVLFTRELVPALLELARESVDESQKLFDFLYRSEVFFLHLSMAASKATADAAHGIEGSSIVTAMAVSCREFAIRVSGLGKEWFRGPIPQMQGKVFDGFTLEDVGQIGGESMITETTGLGGLAQAAAFPLQAYNGGTSNQMVENTLKMYEITTREHPEFSIPYLAFRGTPLGIDVSKVVAKGITPIIDAGLAHKDGGQIGAGILRAPVEPFKAAWEALTR